MSYRFKLGCVVVVSCLLGAAGALAQPQKGGMGMPRYDKSTEMNIKGTVQDVLQPQGRGRMMGIHLMVKTDKETVEVHLGPSTYISNQGFQFAKGDEVEIVGSKVSIAGSEALIAREVTKDGKKLTLRDETGRPLWAGRRS